MNSIPIDHSKFKMFPCVCFEEQITWIVEMIYQKIFWEITSEGSFSKSLTPPHPNVRD